MTTIHQTGMGEALTFFVLVIFAASCIAGLAMLAHGLHLHYQAHRDLRRYRRQRDAARKLERDLRNNSRPHGHVRRAA